MRLAVAGLQHRHRGFVGVQHGPIEHLRFERIDQRLQLHATGANPVRQRRARQCQARPLEDTFLAIQRQVIGVLRHEHLGEQSGRGQSLVDDVGRHRRLGERLAVLAHPLAAHMALDREYARRVVELLGHILADAFHLAAATALGVLWFVVDFAARQPRRQGRAPGLRLRCRLLPGGCELLELFGDRLQVFFEALFEQAALLALEALLAGGELQALEHRHLVRELVDGGLLVAHLGEQPLREGAHFGVAEVVQRAVVEHHLIMPNAAAYCHPQMPGLLVLAIPV